MSEITECRHCHKPFNQKIRYCPFCGGEQVKDLAKKTPLCPRCRCEMKAHIYREIEIDLCPECSGAWLDPYHFKHLTSERDVYADRHIPNQYVKQSLSSERGYLPCTQCEKLMLRVNFGGISNILIDICRDHGVWLDKGELEQIRCFIANGGLEASQNKEITEIKDELQSLAGRLQGVEFMQEILHSRNLKYRLFKSRY